MKKFLVFILCCVIGCASANATNVKVLYGTNNQAITLTITSLATATFRQSTAIDNTANLWADALVTCKVKSNAAGTSATGYVAVYAYGTANGGTDYDGGASGTDGSYTKDVTPPNLQLVGLLTLNANATTVRRTFAIAAAFGGQLPDHWGLVFDNETGATLDASVGSCFYQGIGAQTQ